MGKRLTASTEDYLEAIAALNEQGKKVTVTGISEALGVKKPSVTEALKRLVKAELVVHEKYGDIALTAEGARIGWEIYGRHKTLRLFFIDILDIDPETANQDACHVEHWLSPASMERMVMFLDFVINCPSGKPLLLEGLKYYFEHGERNEEIVARCQEKRES